MGFWDARLSDLEARGVQFSDEEVEILERGGRVVHLHPLEEAEDGGWPGSERDGKGEVVLTVEVLRTTSPLDRYNSPWKQEFQSVAEALDGTYGRRRWTAFPVYPAVVDLELPKGNSHWLDGHHIEWRAEELNPYAWWNCIPYDPSMDQALGVLMQAQSKRIAEAMWESYHWIADTWRNYMDPLDAWLYTFHPNLISDEDRDNIVESYAANYGGDDDEIERSLRSMGEEMDAFYKVGAINFPTGLEVNGHLIENPYPEVEATGLLPWKPMEQYIPAHEVEAWNLWNRMTARRRLGLSVTDEHPNGTLTKEDIE